MKEFESEFSYSYKTYAVNATDEHVVHEIRYIDRYVAGFGKDRFKVFEFDAKGAATEKTWE